MSAGDPVMHDLTAAQIDKQVSAAEHEGAPHRVVEMADATVRSVYGPQDETISSGDARDVETAKGLKHSIAVALARVLDVFSADHPEKALISDYVRAVLEVRRTRAALDAATLAEVDKQLATPAIEGAQ